MVAGVGMLLLLYVLMFGMAVRFYDDCPEPVQTGIEMIYTPVLWLMEYTPLEGPIEAYAEWWER